MFSENKEIFNFWMQINTQWRVGMNGVIGLDYVAVIAVADILCIDISPAILRKIKALEMITIKSQNDKNESSNSDGGEVDG